MFKTKTLHLKTKTNTFCDVEADRKAFFIFGRKRKCRRKWNSIYGRKRNEIVLGHLFSAEKQNESHLIILVFFSYIQSPCQPYNAPPIPRPVSHFLQVVLVDTIPLSSCTGICGIFLDDISVREQFAFLVYCYRVKAIFTIYALCFTQVSVLPNK